MTMDFKHCNTCGELATRGVTDAIETPDGWTESAEMRFGCQRHSVEANAILLTGETMTVREYETFRHSS